MVTLLFLIIAYAIRKRFLPEDANRWDKLIYYSFCVVCTPLFGPRVYKWVAEPNPKDESNKDKDSIAYTYPGFL
jgi:hypothetical protein